jgi:hypothetical protein
VSRADKRAARAAARAVFLRQRVLVRCECGAPFRNEVLAELAARVGANEVVCLDCAPGLDVTGWTIEEIGP